MGRKGARGLREMRKKKKKKETVVVIQEQIAQLPAGVEIIYI